MAIRMQPIDECLAGELHSHFLDFIEEKQGIPLERAFWGWLIRSKIYTAEALPIHIFRYQFGRLVREGYIGIDPDTRCLIPRREVKITVDR